MWNQGGNCCPPVTWAQRDLSVIPLTLGVPWWPSSEGPSIAAAGARVQSLAWELLHAMGTAKKCGRTQSLKVPCFFLKKLLLEPFYNAFQRQVCVLADVLRIGSQHGVYTEEWRNRRQYITQKNMPPKRTQVENTEAREGQRAVALKPSRALWAPGHTSFSGSPISCF